MEHRRYCMWLCIYQNKYCCLFFIVLISFQRNSDWLKKEENSKEWEKSFESHWSKPLSEVSFWICLCFFLSIIIGVWYVWLMIILTPFKMTMLGSWSTFPVNRTVDQIMWPLILSDTTCRHLTPSHHTCHTFIRSLNLTFRQESLRS